MYGHGMGSLGAFTQPGCDCAEPPKPAIATEASTNAVTNDFIIFVTPYFACSLRAASCTASLQALLLVILR
jgi:hypothetical protein